MKPRSAALWKPLVVVGGGGVGGGESGGDDDDGGGACGTVEAAVLKHCRREWLLCLRLCQQHVSLCCVVIPGGVAIIITVGGGE